ncbi:MAG: hypothetical protein LBI33_07480 [Propionibacteriaceae bacterium]|jgi:hypothetical protein|nr:hypothetical protein [Propionibacteriaceae bacterium]
MRPRRYRETGRIVAMIPVASLAALICVGIGVDFSGQVAAEQVLRDQASHCARAGATAATLGANSEFLALAGAETCLSEGVLVGTARLDGRVLTVELTGTYPTKLLSIIAIDRLPLRGAASVGLAQDR